MSDAIQGTAETAKPRRRIEIVLKLGADSWQEAANTLLSLSRDLDRKPPSPGSSGNWCSGAPCAGYVMEYSEDESVTHDSYFEAVDGYLDAEQEADRG